MRIKKVAERRTIWGGGRRRRKRRGAEDQGHSAATERTQALDADEDADVRDFAAAARAAIDA